MTRTIEVEIDETGRIHPLQPVRELPKGRALVTWPVDEGALAGTPKAETRPIWEVIHKNMEGVSPEEFAKLPKDGASEHDHYLYGHPKRNQ